MKPTPNDLANLSAISMLLAFATSTQSMFVSIGLAVLSVAYYVVASSLHRKESKRNDRNSPCNLRAEQLRRIEKRTDVLMRQKGISKNDANEMALAENIRDFHLNWLSGDYSNADKYRPQ